MARSALMNVMVGAAAKAGRRLARDFGEVENLQVSVKGPGDFVTKADMEAEKTIYEELSRARPDFGFLMEERGEVEGKDPESRWIVDPMNGTTNFLHSIPIFAISIALEREGQIVAAVIYNPLMDELFTAEKGGGAFFNDRRIRVANRRHMTDGLFGVPVPHLGRGNHGDSLRQIRNLMANTGGIRSTGAPAIDLAWVAAGRFDGIVGRENQPWDTAAGLLLVREAGGFVSDIHGRDDIFGTGTILAANERLIGELERTANKGL
ncbi:inositol monophosphatase family protein [Notoacmeibacter ruber]|uniref:Inositol-1-monophosphatase n=1 Tax=Notoacmeibacter ruber TaxID=2670375 RepID=A0A3L7JE12_9HYPH|nr:inositol monophosphatase family protein [Notoacmeibacter ruber]RLQ88694.1 inositol monophosphatase [Notoacmeibacter ruber]